MRYFDTAASDHHADEEEDLFPALLEAVAGSDAVCIREMTRALVAEHRQLERHWPTLRRALVQVASGLADSLPLTELQAFVELYERQYNLVYGTGIHCAQVVHSRRWNWSWRHKRCCR